MATDAGSWNPSEKFRNSILLSRPKPVSRYWIVRFVPGVAELTTIENATSVPPEADGTVLTSAAT